MARTPSALLALWAALAAALVLLPQPASAFVRVFGTKFADENCNEVSGGPVREIWLGQPQLPPSGSPRGRYLPLSRLCVPL